MPLCGVVLLSVFESAGPGCDQPRAAPFYSKFPLYAQASALYTSLERGGQASSCSRVVRVNGILSKRGGGSLELVLSDSLAVLPGGHLIWPGTAVPELRRGWSWMTSFILDVHHRLELW